MTTPAPVPAALSMDELENTVRNGKKKLYWSAYEVVLTTLLPSGEARETRYDAYQVNHNSLKKIHNGARGTSYVRVECKYCTAPRFTQSITVSTKKFEEHYMTLHALDALASANTKKAEQLKLTNSKSSDSSKHRGSSGQANTGDDGEEGGGEGTSGSGEEEEEEEEGGSGAGKRSRVAEDADAANKRRRRGALTKDDDDHVAAMAGAAAAVVALSGGPAASPSTTTTSTAPPLPSSAADSSAALDPAESDTKRAKKVYWTAYEVVLSQRTGSGGEVQETRQDAWRVNHNALRRMHLDPSSSTSVRVECRFCTQPKFSQSITVSTRKFEHHYFLEHGNAGERQAVEDALLKKAAEVAFKKAAKSDGTSTGEGAEGADGGQAPVPAGMVPRRRKSWKALLLEREAWRSSDASSLVPQQRDAVFKWLVHELMPLEVAASDRFFSPGTDSSEVMIQQLRDHHTTHAQRIKQILAQALQHGVSVVLSVQEVAVRSGGPLDPIAHQSHWIFTVHYVSPQWMREQHVLACRPVRWPLDENCVRDVVHTVLTDSGIPLHAVYAVVSRFAPPHPLHAALTSSSSPPLMLRCAADALHAVAIAGASTNWQAAFTDATPTSSVATVLAPFARVAEDLSRASYPTMPMVYQYFRHLRESLLTNSASATLETAAMAATMTVALDHKYDDVVTVDTLVACVLDPRFRLSLIAPADEKRVRERLVSALGGGGGGGGGGEGAAAEPLPSEERPTRSLFEELATSSKRVSLGGGGASPSAEAIDELHRYLAMADESFNVDVLQWWAAHESQLPTLAAVARRYLALVGTSLPAEEAFTRTGQQLALRRSVLDPALVEAYVVVRSSLSVVDDAAVATVAAPAPLPSAVALLEPAPDKDAIDNIML